jgi:hypothetical protein
VATGPGFPGPGNVYIPNWEASGRLGIGYARNPKRFHLPKYVQYIESDKRVGYYFKLSPQEAARVVSLNDYLWSPGQPRPTRVEGLEQFNFLPFRSLRWDFGFSIDEDTDRMAEWEVVEAHAQIHAAKAMTHRTIRSLNVLTTAANWQTTADPDLSTTHTATATAFAGGQLNLGSSTSPYIKIFLDKASVLINLDTIGVVESNQLQVIINPNQARLWSESAEVHDYLKGSPDALEEIKSGQSPNGRWGLPSTLYGYPVLVENCVKITSRKGDTLAKSFAMPDQTALMVARVGDLDGIYGMPSFSTLTYFWYRDDMTLERFDDPHNRLTEAHVVDDGIPVLTSPLSGFMLTATTSVAS